MVNALLHGAGPNDRGHIPLPATLVEALRQAKSIDRLGLGFVQPDLSVRELTWRHIVIEAERRAARFLEMGLVRGERIALFVHDEEPFVFAFFGAVLVGLIPVPMCPPLLMGSMEQQLKRVLAIVMRSGATCIVGPEDMRPILDSLLERAATLRSRVTYEELAESVENSSEPLAVIEARSDDLCFLQFTSGSTSQPKGVEVSHGNLRANTQALHSLLETDVDRRVGVTWTPLFHDMGLCGSLVPTALFRGRHIFIPPAFFARRPQTWLEMIDRYRGTSTTANNFALRSAMRRLPDGASLDLSSLQVIIVGSEPIHPDIARSFIAALRPYGLREEVLSPAYGMAEATLAISASRRNDHLRVIAIARDAYERHGRVQLAHPDEPSQRVVDCGVPLPGHDLAIIDTDGNPLPQDCVGEIVVRGPSVSRGYFQDPEATRGAFHDGWLKTGDLGFVHEGRIFISGRLKDLIIIAGRNLYPQDVEWTVSQLPGVRRGHVIAFSVLGPEGEQLVVLAEGDLEQPRESTARHIREVLVREFGVSPRDVLVTKPKNLPKTTSGKPQRAQCRADYLSGRLGRHSALETEQRE